MFEYREMLWLSSAYKSRKKKRDLLSILHLIDSICHDFYNKLETYANTRYIDPNIADFSDA